MGSKRFSVCCSVFLVLFCTAFLANGDDDLFSKLKIQPVRDKKKAPEFVLEGLGGRKAELRSFRGKVIFLNFWATWCGPCKEEMPSIEALHQHFKGKNFVVLTVSVDHEGASLVEKFIARHGYTFYVMIDPKSKTLDLYQVEKIPMTFLIDKKGMIVGKAIGPRDWKSQEALSLFNRLIETIEK